MPDGNRSLYAGHADDIPEPERPPYEAPLDILKLSEEPAPDEHRLTLRLFRHPLPCSEAHSYIAGYSDLGGLSPRLPTVIPYAPERTTLARLRIPIEVVNVDGMLRRTSLFQELLAVMVELKNPHDYPSAASLGYRFGVWPEDDCEKSAPGTVPTIIPKEDEDDLVAKWIPDPLTRDLIIVPQTQLDPEDRCTLVRCAGDEDGKRSLDVF